MLCKKLFGCGRPPQTKRSCWRKQQNQTGRISIGIKRVRECTGICRCKRHERLLACWNGPGPKKVERAQQDDDRHYAKKNGEFLFHI